MKTIKKANFFENVIGQARALMNLSLRLNGYKSSSHAPHILFSGNAGQGKTFLAEATARAIHKIEKEKGNSKPMIVINASAVKNLKEFVEDYLIPQVEGKRVTVFIDECHELPKKVVTALLTILQPNDRRKNSYKYLGYDLEFDFTMQTFIFATTELHRMFAPLRDRLTKIDLEDYSHDELAQIITLGVGKNITFKKDILRKVAESIRQNGRSAQKVSGDIRDYVEMEEKSVFEDADWKLLSESLDILPLGLERSEVKLLTVLENATEASATMLQNRLGTTLPILRDMERYLTRMGLLKIDGSRSITKEGKEYLDNLRAAGRL
jgi:Holliday junction resolvasome RuvABC ATP-dependent DNA helicase subunit